MFRLLDLFCGAGGAAMGYHQALERAGIAHTITGVDINPQPRYPFVFVQGDALEYAREHAHEYDFIHASPPCQGYSVMTKRRWQDRLDGHPLLIDDVRALISERPYCIENVAGARRDLINPVLLCGTMFGLETKGGNQLIRHRYFETSFSAMFTPPCAHNNGSAIGVYGGGQNPARRKPVIIVTGSTGGYSKSDQRPGFRIDDRRDAMGIQWMTGKELSEAIPPAYTDWIMSRYLEVHNVT